MKQALFLCLDNDLSKSQWISYETYNKVPYHKKKTWIDFWGLWLEPSKNKGSEPRTFVLIVDDTLNKKGMISVKMYYKMPYPQKRVDLIEFWRFWLESFRKKVSSCALQSILLILVLWDIIHKMGREIFHICTITWKYFKQFPWNCWFFKFLLP